MRPKNTVWQVSNGTKTIEVVADSRQQAHAFRDRLLESLRSTVTAKRVVRKAVG